MGEVSWMLSVLEGKAALEAALETVYFGFHLYGAGMDVRAVPGHYNGKRMVGAVRHALRRGDDGVNYYLNNGKQDVYSFNACQGFDFEMNRFGDLGISRNGVHCTLLAHVD